MDDAQIRRFVEMALKLVELRDKRREFADSLEDPRRSFERMQADHALRDKFTELVEVIRDW